MEKLHPSCAGRCRMKLKDYMAIVRKAGHTKSLKLLFKAPSTGGAIDKMYSSVEAGKAEDIEEYELMEMVGKDTYMPVAYKGPSKVSKEQTVLPSVIRTTYIPYTQFM